MTVRDAFDRMFGKERTECGDMWLKDTPLEVSCVLAPNHAGDHEAREGERWKSAPRCGRCGGTKQDLEHAGPCGECQQR